MKKEKIIWVVSLSSDGLQRPTRETGGAEIKHHCDGGRATKINCEHSYEMISSVSELHL